MEQNLNKTVAMAEPKISFFSKTLLWFGYALVLTFLIAFGVPGIIFAANVSIDTFTNALYVMCGVGAVGVIIFSIVVMFKSCSLRGLGVVTFTLYAIFMGLALTPLYLIGSTPTGLLGIIYSVGITGGIFVLMGLIGVLSRGKIGVMLSLVIALCIGSLILSLVNLFVFNETIYWICSFAILLVFILYVGIDFAIIAAHPNNAANEHAVLCAFSLYTDFIVIFLRLLPIIIRLIGDR
jgi:FtsH-binding integral membrane protein